MTAHATMRRLVLGAAFVASAALSATAQDRDGPVPPEESARVTGRIVAAPGDVASVEFRRQDAVGPLVYISRGETRSVDVDAQGEFALSDVLPGRYELVVHGSRNVSRDVWVSADTVVPDVVVSTVGGGAIRGRLTGEEPPEGLAIAVVLLSAEGRAEQAVEHAPGESYEFRDLPDGSYWVWAYATDTVTASAQSRFEIGDQCQGYARVSVEGSPVQQDIELARAATLTLDVRSAVEDEFVDGAVRIENAPRWAVDNTFRIESGVAERRVLSMAPAGRSTPWPDPSRWLTLWGVRTTRVDLAVTALGFEPWRRERVAVAQEPVRVQLEPIAGSYLVPAQPCLAIHTRSSDDSPWELLAHWYDEGCVVYGHLRPRRRAFLPAGSYQVLITSPFSRPLHSEHVEVPDDHRSLRVSPSELPDARLWGRLTTASGVPIPYVEIFCFLRTPLGRLELPCQRGWTWPKWPKESKREGWFSIGGLGEGEYELALDADGASVIGEFQISAADLDGPPLEREFVWKPR